MKNNFRILLAEQKLKMVDINRETGISYQTLGSLYHERTKNPSIQVLKKICEALDCTLDELIPNEE